MNMELISDTKCPNCGSSTEIVIYKSIAFHSAKPFLRFKCTHCEATSQSASTTKKLNKAGWIKNWTEPKKANI